MRKWQTNTIVVSKESSDIGKIINLNKTNNTYDIYFFKQKEIKTLSCNYVRRISVKDLSTKDILSFLSLNPEKWHNWCFNDDYDVRQVFPSYVSDKLILRKMDSLISRGLIEGCACGCRGDFQISEEGLHEIRNY